MTASKAREILEAIWTTAEYDGAPDSEDAIKLGSEALEAWVKLREGRTGIFNPYLPSETPPSTS